MRAAIILLSGLALLWVMPLSATIINVPCDQPTIQAGIDASVNGDTVLVAAGTYLGRGNKELNTLGKAISILSEAGPELTEINCENNGSGFYIGSGEDSNTVISGFTISNAYSDSWPGNAIRVYSSSPKISNCIFTSNRSIYGGAIYLNTATYCVISNCIFSSNSSFGQSEHGGYGGAMLIQYSDSVLIKDCLFIENISRRGGATGFDNSIAAEFSNCIFAKNVVV